MTQYATPIADLHDGAWLNEAASAVDMYQSVDPAVPGSLGAGDDSTYIESDAAPVSSPVVFDLATISDPVSSAGHVMTWRRGKDVAGGAQCDLTVELRQGYVSEASPGTLINSFSDTAVPDSFANQADTLTGAEADAITDYSDLQWRLVGDQV